MDQKLKVVTSFRAVHTDGLEEERIRDKEYLYQRTEYDESGHLLSEETFMADGSLEHKSSYTFDNEGRMIEEILVEEGDIISEHRTMEYDQKGRLLSEKRHYLDESYDESTYTYDAEDRIIEKVTAGSDGEFGSKLIFRYEGKYLVSETEYDIDGDILSSREFEYDEKGNLISESINSPEETFEASHEYDDNGHRKVSRKYDDQGHLVERHTYTREADSLVAIKEESVTGTELISLEYDERGNLLRQETTKEKGDFVSRIIRSYDEHDLLQTTQVFMEGSGQRLAQDYRIRFEYELWEDGKK